jgi:hypothetical protein
VWLIDGLGWFFRDSHFFWGFDMWHRIRIGRTAWGGRGWWGALGWAVAALPLGAVADQPGPPDQGWQWRDVDKDGNAAPIEVQIDYPDDSDKTGSPAAHYVAINHALTLSASATDIDSYCRPEADGGDNTWYDYQDDVTSGDLAADHHLWWTVTSGDGEFPETSKYGTAGTYHAPVYKAGQDLRDVRVRAAADDYQRNGDELGSVNDDGEVSDPFDLKVWQITVDVQQDGFTDPDSDATPAPIQWGGTDLGWVIPGTPAGAEGYFGNTQITGTIPAGPGVLSGFSWDHRVIGTAKGRYQGTWYTIYDAPDWRDDTPHPVYTDVDPRHPDSTGPDKRKLFMNDSPGFTANASNDNLIAIGWDRMEIDYEFKAFVAWNGTKVSNEKRYVVKFGVEEVNQHWSPLHHQP